MESTKAHTQKAYPNYVMTKNTKTQGLRTHKTYSYKRYRKHKLTHTQKTYPSCVITENTKT